MNFLGDLFFFSHLKKKTTTSTTTTTTTDQTTPKSVDNLATMESTDSLPADKPPRARPLSLQDLPVELQLEIYKQLIIHPVLWERRHEPGCDLRPTQEGVAEQPPFVWQRSILNATYIRNKDHVSNKNKCQPKGKGKGKGQGQGQGHCQPAKKNKMVESPEPRSFALAETWTFCGCARRPNLDIMLACRAIYHVAAPYFWSSNTFSFMDAAEFVACASNTMPSTLALIRAVSVLSAGRGGDWDPRVDIRGVLDDGTPFPGRRIQWAKDCLPAFWGQVRRLGSLKRLAVPYTYFEYFSLWTGAEELRGVLESLPSLEHLDLNRLSWESPGWELKRDFLKDKPNFWGKFSTAQAGATFYSYAKRVDVQKLRREEITERNISQMNKHKFVLFHEKIHGVIYDSFFHNGPDGAEPDQPWTTPEALLVDTVKTVAIPMPLRPQFPKTQVTFYSYPLSKASCEASRLALAVGPSDTAGEPLYGIKGTGYQTNGRRQMIRSFEVECRGKAAAEAAFDFEPEPKSEPEPAAPVSSRSQSNMYRYKRYREGIKGNK